MEGDANRLALDILKGGPEAITKTLELTRQITDRPIDQDLKEFTSRYTAEISANDEAQQGIRAFMEKRAAVWNQKQGD